MARYYNATRTPLSATLQNGETAFFAPKTWSELPSEVENSSSLIQLVKKGFLVRRNKSVPKVEVLPEITQETPSPKAPEPPIPVAEVPEVAVEPSVETAVAEIPVHVDAQDASESGSFDDRTYLSDGVSEESIASEEATDTESNTTRRTKSRRR